MGAGVPLQMSEDAKECFICMGGEPPCLKPTPCACSGSLGNVHDACLQSARASSPLRECPVCRVPFPEPELREVTLVKHNRCRKILALVPLCGFPTAVSMFVFAATRSFLVALLCGAVATAAIAAALTVATRVRAGSQAS